MTTGQEQESPGAFVAYEDLTTSDSFVFEPKSIVIPRRSLETGCIVGPDLALKMVSVRARSNKDMLRSAVKSFSTQKFGRKSIESVSE
jgi:hypothetical protein